MPEKGHNGALQVVQEMSALWQRSPTVTVHRRPLGTHFSPWHRETIDGKEKGVCPCGGGVGGPSGKYHHVTRRAETSVTASYSHARRAQKTGFLGRRVPHSLSSVLSCSFPTEGDG